MKPSHFCAMLHPAQLIQLANGEGAVYSAVGDVYRILASGEQTAGAYALCEARVLPGGGPPPHIHKREDESFFVLEGQITFTLDGSRVVARAGAFIQGPRGVPHAFRNESNAPARMLILTVPSGFEKFMAEFATPLPSFASDPIPPSPAEVEKLIALAPKYGIELLPPPGH